jgi:hypothetical protein
MPITATTMPGQVYNDLAQRFAPGRFLENGESVYDIGVSGSGVASVTQQLTLAGFRAVKTEQITRLQFCTGATAAGATPTLVRAGVYVRQAGNVWGLAASFANDTAVFAAANTTYTKTLTSTFNKQAGQDYAIGLLIVSAAAFPVLVAPPQYPTNVGGWATDVLLAQPMTFSKVITQADLPTSIPAASVVASITGQFHCLMLN